MDASGICSKSIKLDDLGLTVFKTAPAGRNLAKIISIINFKGGVGKTTVSVNLSACLAADPFKKRVLLVDLDPQSNTSIWMMGAHRWQKIALKKKMNSSYGLFHDKTDLSSVIITPYDEPTDAFLPRLSLIPAIYHMHKLEEQIIRDMIAATTKEKYTPHQEHKYLAQALVGNLDDYEYVVFDCPPNFYNVAKNALFCSDYYLVPCIPDSLSVIGLNQLIEQVDEFVQQMKTYKPQGRTPTLLGVIVNRFERVKDMEKGLDKIHGTIERLRNTGNVLTVNKKSLVFDNYPIGKHTADGQAVDAHKPLCLFAPKSPAYRDVSALTQAIIKTLEGCP